MSKMKLKKIICHQAFMRYFMNSPYVNKMKNSIKHEFI